MLHFSWHSCIVIDSIVFILLRSYLPCFKYTHVWECVCAVPGHLYSYQPVFGETQAQWYVNLISPFAVGTCLCYLLSLYFSESIAFYSLWVLNVHTMYDCNLMLDFMRDLPLVWPELGLREGGVRKVLRQLLGYCYLPVQRWPPLMSGTGREGEERHTSLSYWLLQ